MFKASKYSACVGFVASLLLSGMLSGCASTARNTTSVVDYLYPDKQEIVTPSIPTLTLPVRVGIAFAPGNSVSGVQNSFLSGKSVWSPRSSTLTEKQKLDLMREVADHFMKYRFVKNIELIPSHYLAARGGFANLDQVRTMFGVDEIVLISYDQTQFTDEGILSLTYWTIVGAYVVQAEINDTQTMLDAVVYDIPSRKMLFRAPGTSLVKGKATYVNLGQELRKDSEAGFRNAAENMIANLDAQLAAFRARIKERPADYTVIRPEGYQADGN